MRRYFHAFAAAVLGIALGLPLATPVAAAGKRPAAAMPAKRSAAAPVRHAAPAAHEAVRIENFTFSPPALQVKAGTTVTWTNGDDIPHNVVARNGSFRSKVLDTGDSFSFTFPNAGEFVYFCGLHPHMVGKIIVTA
jgi:plastocyanin